MEATERLVLDLSKELVDRIRQDVASGDFRSESDAVETILTALYFGEDDGAVDLSREKFDEVRAAVAEGLAEADAGHLIPADEVYTNLRTQIRSVAEKAK